MQKQQKKTLVNLTRDVDAIAVPEGDRVVMPKGQLVRILQELGDHFTVMNPIGMRFRIDGKDADALDREPPSGPSDADIAEADTSKEGVEKAAWAEMRKVYDPEIPFNIVDVGLIYECKVEPIAEDRHNVKVLMTLTAPGCGIGDILVNDVQTRIANIPGVKSVDVQMTFDPPWDFSMMSEAARMQLNL